MFRHLERSENTARLIEAGLRIALTRSAEAHDEWKSVVTTAGSSDAFLATHDTFDGASVMDFLLRDRDNPSSVASAVDQARSNARLVRTALTREVWEATNECWMTVSKALEQPIVQRELPRILGMIRQESAIVRGALHGTMMRNDSFDFARLGTLIERADNTARILDVKYYVLLPSAFGVGSPLDNVQWETILRSLSAQRSYRWQQPREARPPGIAEFVILDQRLPRSLAYCYSKINGNLTYLAEAYGDTRQSHRLADDLKRSVRERTIDDIFDIGLHEYLQSCIEATTTLARQIEIDYRFTQ